MACLVEKVTTTIVWVVAVLLLVNKACGEAEHAIQHNSMVYQQSLIQDIIRSSSIVDQEVVTKCFNTYLPIFSEINDDFMEAFEKCSSDAKDRVSKLEQAALADRRQIELAADGVCVALNACGDSDSALRFFDCNSEQANNATRTIYELTQNAKKFGRTLREQYFESEAEMHKCQNASRRVHVEDTAKNHKDLQICLRGGNSSTETPGTTTTTPPTSEVTATDDPSSTTTETPGTIPPYEPDDPNDPREYKFDRNLKILPHLRKFY